MSLGKRDDWPMERECRCDRIHMKSKLNLRGRVRVAARTAQEAMGDGKHQQKPFAYRSFILLKMINYLLWFMGNAFVSFTP